MNPGDLRRFYESPWPLHGESFKAGKIFMIVNVHAVDVLGGASPRLQWVDILLEGKLHNGLGFPWVQQNSETLNETV